MKTLRRFKHDVDWAIFLAELAVLGVLGCAIAGKAVAGFAVRSWFEEARRC